MSEWGIWDIIGLIGGLIPLILVFCYLFPRKSIKNLYIDAKRDLTQTYPKVIMFEMRNLTNETIYILSEGFKFGDAVLPSPDAAKNASTRVYEVKFAGRQKDQLTDIDILVRPNQTIHTYVPVNPKQTNEEIDVALNDRKVGKLKLKCQMISARRNALVRMIIPI
jgi:hypothetical protein